MEAYNSDDVFALDPSVRLRNDGKYVIAGFITSNSVDVLRMGPIEGAMASMFDGSRTCREIEEICTALADKESPEPHEDAKSLVEFFVTNHTKEVAPSSTPLLKPKSELTPEEVDSIHVYNPTQFIVREENFNSDDLKLAYPVTILWLLTNKCPVSCQYCYMPRTTTTKDMLPWERVVEVTREAHSRGLMAIHLSGGDPLCYPHFFEYLDLMDELDFPPSDIPTKAYISAKTAKRLAERRTVGQLQFSIDSTVPEIADFLVNSPGYCERTMKSIRNAKKAGITNLAAKCVITPYNLPTIPKWYRDMKALGIEELRLATYTRSQFHHHDKLFNYEEDYEWFDQELVRLREEYPDDEIFYQNGSPREAPVPDEERQRKWDGRVTCPSGRTGITINAAGRVVACEQMPEREEDYLGNLREMSLGEIWDSQLLDDYLIHPPRERFKGTACFDCEDFQDCQTMMGMCMRQSCKHYGTRWTPPPECPKAEMPLREY